MEQVKVASIVRCLAPCRTYDRVGVRCLASQRRMDLKGKSVDMLQPRDAKHH